MMMVEHDDGCEARSVRAIERRHLARRVWRTEGVRGFYLGLGPAMLRGLALDIIQFSAADALRRRIEA